MADPSQQLPTDQYSKEDLDAMHMAALHLDSAGDPRGGKLHQFLSSQGYYKPSSPDALANAELAKIGLNVTPIAPPKVNVHGDDPINRTLIAGEAALPLPNSVSAGNPLKASTFADMPGMPGHQDQVPVGSPHSFYESIARPAQRIGEGDVAGGVGEFAGMAAQQYILGKAGKMIGEGQFRSDFQQAYGRAPSDAEMQLFRDNHSAANTTKQIASSVKETAGNVATAVGRKVLPSLVDGPPEDLMTRAIKPGKNNTGWNDDIKSAMPNLKSAENDLGRPVQNIDDALEVAKAAKKKLWAQYEQRLGPYKQNATIDGNQIADAMMDSIDKRTAAQHPEIVQQIQKVADTYRRDLTLEDAEDFLESNNRELNTYYSKNKVGRQVAQADPETAYKVAEGDALRQALYDRLDALTGPGAKQLKQQYGALTNVQRELMGRQNVAARQQPQSLSEQLSTARGYGKIAKGVVTLSPGDIAEGAETVATSKYLKERNSTDALIQRAFAKTPVPTQTMFPPSIPRPVAGYLPKGPIITPPPADASGSVPYNPPAYANDTRANRLGLLLPEGKPPVVTPPPADTSGSVPYTPPRVEPTTRPQRMGLMLPERTGGPHVMPPSPEIGPAPEGAAVKSGAVKPTETTNVPLTKEQFRNWEFQHPEGGSSRTPKTVFDWRAKGEMGETLHDIATQDDDWRFREAMTGDGRGRMSPTLMQKIRDDKPITIYRTSEDGGIIPGSYVTESKQYALDHAEANIRGDWKVYKLTVRPSELMTYGDPHEFLYTPKSVDEAYSRYLEQHKSGEFGAPSTSPEPKQLSATEAMKYIRAARGNKTLARQLAAQDGFTL